MTTTPSPATAAPHAFWALLALAVGAFGIGTTEFSPMGLLPVIAEGVHVSIPTAGLLISAYAIGVMVGAPVMTLLLSRYSKRKALIFLMAIFTLGNLLSAMAPDYSTLLAARLVTSLNHGAFFGLGAVVAASVVPREKQASAVAAMFMGLTVANIGGVPAAAWVGHAIGWRMAFAGTALLGLLAMAALWLALPRDPAGDRLDVRRELRVLTRRSVLLAMATTVMGAGAMFTLYTYVAPILMHITGASDRFVTLGLVLIGTGFTVGNWLGGRLADWSLNGSAAIFLAALGLLMLVQPLLLASHTGAAISLLVWGVTCFGLVPPVQMRVMQAAADAPGLASSLNIGAFNLGNALGAGLGAAVLGMGWGYAAIPVTGSFLALAGLMLVWSDKQRVADSVAVRCET